MSSESRTDITAYNNANDGSERKKEKNKEDNNTSTAVIRRVNLKSKANSAGEREHYEIQCGAF